MSKCLCHLILINLLFSLLNSQPSHVPGSPKGRVMAPLQTNRIYNTQDQLISDSAMAIVKDLFQKNNVSLSNLQVYRLITEPSGYYHVRCNQFFKGLKLFANEVIFHFKNRFNSSLTGELITGVTIDTVPKVSVSTAGAWFESQIAQDFQFKDSLNAFRGRGYNAELGIYELKSGVSTMPKNFVLAWKMNVAYSKGYPVGYVRADSLRLIYYDNGVRY
jgi:Zn-dependent metalloprotease